MTKGTCKIILKDVNTGEVKSVKHHNMLTNALANILQPPATFFTAPTGHSRANIADWYNKMLPIAQGALGGVLLFKDSLTEDANNVIPDLAKGCVGHAGGAYSGSNTYRGTLNAAESGPVANGYKSVWDFPTSAANGTIAAVALTSRFGGDCGLSNSLYDTDTNLFDALKSYYLDSYDNNKLKPSASKESSFCDYYSSFETDRYASFAGEFSPGILTFFKTVSATEIDIANVTWKSNLSVSDALQYNPTLTWTKYTVSHDFYSFQWSSIISRTTSGAILMVPDADNYSKIDFIKITPTGVSGEAQFAAPSGSDTRGRIAFEFNGYVYGFVGTTSPYTQLYRIKESDGTTGTINLPESTASIDAGPIFNSQLLVRVNSHTYLFDGTTFTQTMLQIVEAPHLIAESASLPKPYYYYFPTDSSYTYIIPAVFTPYLGTINNLSTPIQKTATQTMKVIYTLTNG